MLSDLDEGFGGEGVGVPEFVGGGVEAQCPVWLELDFPAAFMDFVVVSAAQRDEVG